MPALALDVWLAIGPQSVLCQTQGSRAEPVQMSLVDGSAQPNLCRKRSDKHWPDSLRAGSDRTSFFQNWKIGPVFIPQDPVFIPFRTPGVLVGQLLADPFPLRFPHANPQPMRTPRVQHTGIGMPNAVRQPSAKSKATKGGETEGRRNAKGRQATRGRRSGEGCGREPEVRHCWLRLAMFSEF